MKHVLSDDQSHCLVCGLGRNDTEWPEPCEEEDLSMWCAPGESVQEMLRRASEKD